MSLKKMKKWSGMQLVALLVFAAFTLVMGACPADDGIKATIDDEDDDAEEDVVGGIIIDDGDDPLLYVETGDPINYQTTKSWGTSFEPLTLGMTPGKDTTEINLNWYSSGAVGSKTAEVRFIRGTLAQGYAIHEKTGTAAGASTGNTAHKVTVTGLKPGFNYQYSVSNDGTNWSPLYDYKIPRPTGAWKFAVIADPQLTTGNVDSDSRYPATSVTTAAGWVETMGKIVAAGVSFIASGGDQVDTSSSEQQYTNLFAPEGLRNLPFAPVVGNHDTNVAFSYHYNLPNEQEFSDATGTTAMGHYYYLYNNILFVVLNTGPSPSSMSNAAPYIARFGQTLTAAKAAHAGKYDWLIVQHHKSTASVGDHVADQDIRYYVEAGFETLMSTHNVDFVLAGHDHVYARSYPLKGMDNGKVSLPDKTKPTASGSTWTGVQDPVYLTFTTGSGLKYYSVAADDTYIYNNTLYVKNNTAYPYLGTDATGTATLYGSDAYLAGNLPVSNAAYVQPYIPSYCVVEVNGRSITFSTYPIITVSNDEGKPGYQADGPNRSFNAPTKWAFDETKPYDKITVTK